MTITTRTGCPLLCFIAFALGTCVTGCGEGQDAKVEAALKSAAAEKSKRIHYPVFQFPDFGSENAIRGVTVVVYGSYSKIQTLQNEKLNGITPRDAASRLTKLVVRAVQVAADVQERTPSPVKPPSGTDWTSALHPRSGTYEVLLQYPGQNTNFVVNLGAKPATSSQASIEKQVANFVEKIRKDEADQLTSPSGPGVPAGFSVSATELAGGNPANPGSSSNVPPVGGDPYIHGSPLLLVPIDRGLALKGLRATLLTILDRVRRKSPSAKVANLILVTPFGTSNMPVPTETGKSQDTELQSALDSAGLLIDQLNAFGMKSRT